MPARSSPGPFCPFIRTGLALDVGATAPDAGRRHHVTTCDLGSHEVGLLIRSGLDAGAECTLHAPPLAGPEESLAATVTACTRRFGAIHRAVLGFVQPIDIARFIEPSLLGAVQAQDGAATEPGEFASDQGTRVLLVGSRVREMPWLAESVRAVGRVPAIMGSATAAMAALQRARGIAGVVLSLEDIGHDAALKVVAAIREHGFRGPVIALGATAELGAEIRARGSRTVVLEGDGDELSMLAALGASFAPIPT